MKIWFTVWSLGFQNINKKACNECMIEKGHICNLQWYKKYNERNNEDMVYRLVLGPLCVLRWAAALPPPSTPPTTTNKHAVHSCCTPTLVYCVANHHTMYGSPAVVLVSHFDDMFTVLYRTTCVCVCSSKLPFTFQNLYIHTYMCNMWI